MPPRYRAEHVVGKNIVRCSHTAWENLHLGAAFADQAHQVTKLACSPLGVGGMGQIHVMIVQGGFLTHVKSLGLDHQYTLRCDRRIGLDWLVDGYFFQGRLSRRVKGGWYAGVTARYLDITQALDLGVEDGDYNISSNISAVSLGLNLDYDSRDLPSNAYQGRYLELKALTSHQSNAEDDSYQSYHARFRSYHPLRDSLVLAWEVNGCARGGEVPLGDTCRLGLRGFSATCYLGKRSLYAQAEIRWRVYKRWGLEKMTPFPVTAPESASWCLNHNGSMCALITPAHRTETTPGTCR